MNENDKKIPDNISEIMKGLKASIPDLSGLGNMSGLSNKTINMINEMKTPPIINYSEMNKAFKKKRQNDNIKIWLGIFLTIIGLLIATFTYFKFK